MNRIAAATLVSLFFLSSLAFAESAVGVVFSKDDITIIADWYQNHDSDPAHGDGKKKPKGLPPGIAKNLERGKPLPPGIAKQVLPQGLVAKLSPAPRGYERVVVDGKILLVEVATSVIHDILVDVIMR